jgi:hypothetical protein
VTDVSKSCHYPLHMQWVTDQQHEENAACLHDHFSVCLIWQGSARLAIQPNCLRWHTSANGKILGDPLDVRGRCEER